MWHLHWRADAPRRSRTAEPVPARAGADADTRRGPSRPTAHGSFQHVWHDTPAGTLAADVPESVRVRGR
jgi:hypothetical protein